jgi:hypothetical protein
MKKPKYTPLLIYLNKNQKNIIRKDAFRKKIFQAELMRQIVDLHYGLNDDEEPSLRNQDLGDEPTLPGEDEPLD